MPAQINGHTVDLANLVVLTKRGNLAEYNLLITYSKLDSDLRSELRTAEGVDDSRSSAVRIGNLLTQADDRFAYICQYGKQSDVLNTMLEKDFVAGVLPYQAEWVISPRLKIKTQRSEEGQGQLISRHAVVSNLKTAKPQQTSTSLDIVVGGSYGQADREASRQQAPLAHGTPTSRQDPLTEQEYYVKITFHDDIPDSTERGRDVTAQLNRLVPDAAIKPGPIKSLHLRLWVSEGSLKQLAKFDGIRAVSEVLPVQTCNNRARQILRCASPVHQGPAAVQSVDLAGQGQTVCVTDTGFDREQSSPMPGHPFFLGQRVDVHPLVSDKDEFVAYNALTADLQGHGTHVCGSIAGNYPLPLGGVLRGTAPGVDLFIQAAYTRSVPPYLTDLGRLPDDIEQLFNIAPYDNEESKVRVHCNAFAHIDTSEDYSDLDYSLDGAWQLDKVVFRNPELVICQAAGNRLETPDGDWIGRMHHFAAGKNIIVVGASCQANDEAGDLRRASFSPSGPTTILDRVTPTIVAPGDNIMSARSLCENLDGPLEDGVDGNTCLHSGTSMACALLAGCCVALRGAIIQYGWQSPSAALIKCLLVCFARGVKIPATDGLGWGQPDMRVAANMFPFETETQDLYRRALSVNGLAGFAEGKLMKGQRATFNFGVPLCKGLVVALVWTDPPGYLIQNQMELSLTIDSQPSQQAGGPDGVNNVLRLEWKSNDIAKNVSWSAIALHVDNSEEVDGNSQAFALCWWWIS